MGIAEIVLIGIALSMDAFAVSVSNGMCIRNVNIKKALIIGLAFGLFQALMPAIGYFAGSLFYQQIKAIDHYVALVLLVIIGGKMLFDGIKNHQKDECSITELTFKLLVLQAIATSIDALAVGVSLIAFDGDIFLACIIIGICTFVICVPAVFVGRKFGDMLNNKAEILGGLILIGIGLKIFIEHTFF